MKSFDLGKIFFDELGIGVAVEQDGHDCFGCISEIVDIADV